MQGIAVSVGATVCVETPEATLRDLAQGCRNILLRLLEESIGDRAVRGACLYAAVLVCTTVRKFSACEAQVRGGDGEGNGGYLAADGQSYGHYWVEARDPATGQAWVVDVTADQFDDDAVVVMPLPSASAFYRPGDQSTVDEHVRSEGFHIN